jgi:hypothetical protein
MSKLKDLIDKGAIFPNAEEDYSEEEQDSFRGLPEDLIGWLKGDTIEIPESVDKVSDSLDQKVLMTVSILIVNRLASVNNIIAFMAKAEEELLNNVSEDDAMSLNAKLSYCTNFQKEMYRLMDFAMKLTARNKEAIKSNKPVDPIAELLRDLEPRVLRSLVTLLKEKGASLTEADFSKAGGDNLLEMLE